MRHDLAPIPGRPALDRTAPGALVDGGSHDHTIVHIGVGNFHRAHQAYLLDELFRHEPSSTRWRLVGMGLLESDAPLAEIMAAQDCVYSVVERSQHGTHTRLISSISEVIHAPTHPDDAIELLTAASTRIVSMTVTEGGYSPSTEQIAYALEHRGEPRTWPGYLVEALARRRDLGHAPFTVLSCDNLPGNGSAARETVLSLARRRDPELASWIAEHGRFPSTMVDRITPATTDEVRDLAWKATGRDDRWPVQCEPYLEWRIEDDFVDGLRPDWGRLDGVSFVEDVHPYEVVKLRLLNLAHQAIAYPGLLLGLGFSHEAIEDPDIRVFVERLMDREVAPFVRPPPGVSVATYRAMVVERFANPHLGDTLDRLATDSVSRLRQFAGPPIDDVLAAGSPSRALALLVALWAITMSRADEVRLELFCGPRAPEIARVLGADRDPRSLIERDARWSPVIGATSAFWDEVSDAVDGLRGADPDRIRGRLRGDP